MPAIAHSFSGRTFEEDDLAAIEHCLVDKQGRTVDLRLSEHWDIEAARDFFRKAVATAGAPMRVTLDGHWPSHRALFELRREARI